MSEVYKYIREDDLDNGEALNDNLLFDLLLGTKGVPVLAKTIYKGTRTLADFLPYSKDAWDGRNLLIHKSFDKMTPEELKNYGSVGKKYYKEVLHPQTVENEVIGTVKFPNVSAGKADYQYMEQYPLLRYNISKARENKHIPNKYERPGTSGFENLKVNWKGKDYAYQIKNNSYDKTMDYYNIKPYELLD